MPIDREIYDARQAVIDAARWRQQVEKEGKMGSGPAASQLDQRLAELDALLSKSSAAAGQELEHALRRYNDFRKEGDLQSAEGHEMRGEVSRRFKELGVALGIWTD